MKQFSEFKTIALIGKHNTTGVGETLFQIAKMLTPLVENILLEEYSAKFCQIEPSKWIKKIRNIEYIGKHADIAIVLGGDGTLLSVARTLAPFKVPLIGINFGRLGFITDIAVTEINSVIPAMLNGKYKRDERLLLSAHIERNKKIIHKTIALNDVVVNRSGVSGMVDLRVEVDHCFMYKMRSDGLIVSTTTGSTAYALAVQGPILQPQLNGILLAPIAPHTLSNRPIVLNADVEIRMQIIGGREVNVNFDMQSFTALETSDTIVVKQSTHRAILLHPQNWSYFKILREKLKWLGGDDLIPNN